MEKVFDETTRQNMVFTMIYHYITTGYRDQEGIALIMENLGFKYSADMFRSLLAVDLHDMSAMCIMHKIGFENYKL